MKHDIISDTECCTSNSTESISSVNNMCCESNANSSNFLSEIINKDKLKIILSIIGDENCPIEYLNKFKEFVDCLKYILSYTPNNSYRRDNKKHTEKCHDNKSSFSKAKETTKDIQHDIESVNTEPKEIKEHSKQTEKYVKLKFRNINNDIENMSSNSDSYMGIPKINLNNLLISKVRKRTRYNDIKNCNKNKGINKEKQFQEKNTLAPIQTLNNDSSTSIFQFDYKSCEKKKHKFKKQRFSGEANINQDNVKKNNNVSEIANEHTNDIQKIKNKKPIIKSSEHVYFDLKLKNQIRHNKTISDIRENLDKTAENKEILSNNSPMIDNNITMNDNDITVNEDNIIHGNEMDEHLIKELLKHPFLTYDSEDFENNEEINKHLELQTSVLKTQIEDKKALKNISKTSSKFENISFEKKGMPYNNKIIYNEPLGSKQNPKLLISWTPFVELDNQPHNKYNLKFKGKLLNEAGHVLRRKFITNSVHQRHSLKLVETLNNEYFLLVGEFNNKNHIVPKELLKQCSAGCPLKINEFCQEWIKLRSVTTQATNDNKSTNLSNTSLKDITVSTSSRGRRIVPPLNYWHGERLLTKNFDSVYHPGTPPQASLVKESKMVHKNIIKKNWDETNKKRIKKCRRSYSMCLRSLPIQSVESQKLKESKSLSIDSSDQNSYYEFHPCFIKVEKVNDYNRQLFTKNQDKNVSAISNRYNLRRSNNCTRNRLK